MKSIFKLLYDLQENLNQRIHNVSGRNLKLKNTMRLLFFFRILVYLKMIIAATIMN